jgi:hypothetical protein
MPFRDASMVTWLSAHKDASGCSQISDQKIQCHQQEQVSSGQEDLKERFTLIVESNPRLKIHAM